MARKSNNSAGSFDDASVPRFLTVAQVANFFQVRKGTVYTWSSQGRLDFCKRRLGRHVRFHRDRLINHLEEKNLND